MGRKNKNVLGGAASGAAAGTSVMPGWGTAIGAVAGGILGSQNDSDAQQQAPVIPQDVVDRLYAQANGGAPTAGELNNSMMYDKSLAQQIAAARTQNGVNPGLLQRNVARIAAEQSQANAQSNAIVSSAERQKAMANYIQARQLNSGVEAQNLGFERNANSQANNMLGAGINSLGASFALGAQKSDAQRQIDAQNQMQGTASNSVKDPMSTSGMSLSGTDEARQINGAYGLGANTNLGSYMEPQSSDYRMKTDVKSEKMKVTSDMRQKDLVKSENLPPNNNLGMQNQNAMQPTGMPPQQNQMQQGQVQPGMAGQPAPVQQQAQAPAPVAPASNFGITSDMLTKAQDSSKKGGDLSDIQNQSTTLQRAAQGPSTAEITEMGNDARRRQSRDIFGNVTQSDADNYQANLGRWYAARDAQNAAYDKQAGDVTQNNQVLDAQRLNRLNRFYTGIGSGNTGVVSSQYAPKVMAADASWGNAQQLDNVYRQSPEFGARSLRGLSDERQKTDKTAEGAADFNPKSFLDKLQAYSYEYKKGAEGLPGVDDGRHLSVMAQDLEKAGPVGKSMVEQDESGNKVVDYGKGFGAILASQAHLNERLSNIEKMYPKKKKEA